MHSSEIVTPEDMKTWMTCETRIGKLQRTSESNVLSVSESDVSLSESELENAFIEYNTQSTHSFRILALFLITGIARLTKSVHSLMRLACE
jgi:hypothetical protein